MMSLLRKARRSSLKTILIWACFMIPASAFLYSTNGQVRALQNEMQATQAALDHEKESSRILRAEWAYLNNPQRLANAAKQYLTGSQVVTAAQILPMDRLTAKLAMRDASPSGVAVASNTVKGATLLAQPIAFEKSFGDSGAFFLPSRATTP